MRYVLDTNIVSALMAGQPRAIGKLASLGKDQITVPQPVFAEIEYGIARLPRSKRKTRLGEIFELLCKELPHASWTDDVSAQFGAIKASLEKKGERIEDFDVAIAAHALAEGSILVTANAKHMKRVRGLKVEDWA